MGWTALERRYEDGGYTGDEFQAVKFRHFQINNGNIWA